MKASPVLFTLLLPLLLLASAPANARTMEDMKIAVLRSIDKISARTMTFEIPVGKTVKFGNSLYIKARACRKAPAIEQPESSAFLQIWEKDVKTSESKWVFSGWMFASSPAVSAMEHPVYDVWVMDCRNDTTAPAETQQFSSETAPAPETAAPDDSEETAEPDSTGENETGF